MPPMQWFQALSRMKMAAIDNGARPPAAPGGHPKSRSRFKVGIQGAGVARQSTAEVDGGRRSKRTAILDAAVDAFGEHGYEATKWSLVAEQVGIGQTALYHYFESKVHCLLTIMRTELSRSHGQFLEVAGPAGRAAGRAGGRVRGDRARGAGHARPAEPHGPAGGPTLFQA
jgi:hypothetical protein